MTPRHSDARRYFQRNLPSTSDVGLSYVAHGLIGKGCTVIITTCWAARQVIYPEGHEGGLVADGRCLIAHHVRHGQAHVLSRGRQQPGLAHHLVHPRPAALLCTTQRFSGKDGCEAPTAYSSRMI